MPRILLCLLTLSAGLWAQMKPMAEAEKQKLLAAREQVWRALFACDESQLRWMLPEGAMAFGRGKIFADKFENREKIMAGLREFVKAGGKLVALRFPRTEVQNYGGVAVLYTEFEWELESGGNRTRQHGFATEIFHKVKGRWGNPGWHLEIAD